MATGQAAHCPGPWQQVVHRASAWTATSTNEVVTERLSNMGNTLEGAMAVSKAKNFASDAGLSLPGQGDDKKDDAKISAKVAKKQAELEEQKKQRMTKNEELAQRQKERAARKAELEKARGFR